MDQQNHRPRHLLLPCLLVAASAAAWGQEANPYYVGAGQSFTHESNVFRAAGGGTSDWYSTTSLLAGIDQPISRHRLFGDVGLRHVRFNQQDQLNHTGGSILLGLDWSAIDVLSGRVSFNADRSLAHYGDDLPVANFRDLNLQSTQEFIFRGQYGLDALLAVEAGFVHRRLDFSAPQPGLAANEFEQDSVSLGLKYRPTGPLSVGIAVRRTQGQYPSAGNGVTFGDDFDRDDVELNGTWVATGQSTLTARLAGTKEKHQLLTSRNVSTTTGALGWNYKVTGKTELGLDLIRDTGAEAAFALVGAGAAPVNDASVLSTAVQLRAQYDVTAKIQVQASARQQRRDLVNTAGVEGSDKSLETKLGVTWAPLRSLLVGCAVGREKRESTAGVSYSYSATSTRCLAQFKTQ